MEIKEAEEFNEGLKLFMEEAAVELGLEKSIGSNLVDEYIEIYPERVTMKGMIDFTNKGAFSIKSGNIAVNQRKILVAFCNLLPSLTIPKVWLSYIQLFLSVAIFIYETMKLELNETEGYIILYLHSHQMYEQGDEENIFYINFSIWHKQQAGYEVPRKRVEDSVNKLLKIKSIAIENGEIKLKEKVWYNK